MTRSPCAKCWIMPGRPWPSSWVKTKEDFDRDRVLQLALIRLVEVVGEAATRVSPEGRERSPGVPWKGAISMRNRLVHGYDAVDLRVLWDTLQTDLPRLIEELERVLPPRMS